MMSSKLMMTRTLATMGRHSKKSPLFKNNNNPTNKIASASRRANLSTSTTTTTTTKNLAASSSAATMKGVTTTISTWCLVGVTLGVVLDVLTEYDERTYLDARGGSGLPVIMAGNAVEEPDTGIMFPPMVNGFTFMGCGVR